MKRAATAPRRFRPARPGDVPLLATLLTETFAFYGEDPPCPRAELESRLARHLGTEPGFEALLAETEGGETLGYALFAPVFWTSDCAMGLFLKEIYLRPNARGAGLGRALMAELARTAQARGWTKLVWTVDRPNRSARRFYDSLPGARQLDKLVYIQAGEALRRLSAEAC